MTKKIEKIGFLLFCVVFAYGALFQPMVAAAPGDMADPLVTKSWVDDYLADSFAPLEAQIAEIQKTMSDFSSGPAVILYLGSTKAFVNNREQKMEIAPSLRQNCTFVPFRFVSEAMGAAIGWDEKTKQVRYELAGKKILLTIGSLQITVDGEKKQLLAAPYLANNRTMIPLRAVAEALGFGVNWMEAEKKIEIW